MKQFSSIVLNIPHSSIKGIEETQWEHSSAFIDSMLELTDWGTDYIFNRKKDNIKAIIHNYSRFVVDVERLENDPMEEIGQGILYTKYNEFERKISPEERAQLMSVYYEYHKKLKKLITPNCLLIDCHSFPNRYGDVDICIGYNEDWSKPSQEIIKLVANTFENSGYSVSYNTPFSNSISPKMEFEYPSIMIELNKKIYLKECSMTEFSLGVGMVMLTIDKLYDALLK